jgi:hypothetical protein
VNIAEVVDQLSRRGELDSVDVVGELSVLPIRLRPVDAIVAMPLRASRYVIRLRESSE